MAISEGSLLDYLCVYFLRPLIAFAFVFSWILLGWFLAWKLVLVHVPVVQSIFGLRKKPKRPKPETGRYSRYYYSIAQNSSSRESSSGVDDVKSE